MRPLREKRRFLLGRIACIFAALLMFARKNGHQNSCQFQAFGGSTSSSQSITSSVITRNLMIPSEFQKSVVFVSKVEFSQTSLRTKICFSRVWFDTFDAFCTHKRAENMWSKNVFFEHRYSTSNESPLGVKRRFFANTGKSTKNPLEQKYCYEHERM